MVRRWVTVFVLVAAPWSVAAAHPVLRVERLSETVQVSCGPDDSAEGYCLTEPDCDAEPVARTCRETQGGESFCIGPEEALCCLAGDVRAGCPLVEGYDVHCVAVPAGPSILVSEGASFCIYDPAGDTTCADLAAESPELALACHSIDEGGVTSPVAAQDGDCDRDGVPNVLDEAPCDRMIPGLSDAGADGGGAPGLDAGTSVDAGARRDAGATMYDYRGSGGCAVVALRPGHAAGGPLLLVLGLTTFVIARARRSLGLRMAREAQLSGK